MKKTTVKNCSLCGILLHRKLPAIIEGIDRFRDILYVQEVVTQPKILNRTILYNPVHVT